MTAIAIRLLTVTALLMPAGAAAQQVSSPRPGGAPPDLPPHVQAQLWPERELSPVEMELKQHVIVLKDSLTRVGAVGAQIQRQSRSGASAAIVRSSARTLATECARAGRTTGPVTQFAATLSTSDAKWGEPAVRGWRSGLSALTRQLSGCETAAAAMVDGASAEDAERLRDVSNRVDQAMVEYRRTEEALLRTLKITIDPVQKSR